jgi:hypothetical protein
MLIQQHLHPVAEVSRQKGLFRHRGILLADGRVMHCSPARGEHLSSAEEFAAGKDVTIDRALTQTEIAPTLRRLLEALASPQAYDAVENNCETFVNRMLGRRPESQTLHAVVAVAGVAALLGLAATR